MAAIQHFSVKTKREEQAQYLDPDFYSCEFIGFLDDLETRVGCMLHPLARGNMGIDWRGLSFHGAMACKGFFCRSFRQLSSAESSVILGAIQDWYLYGLAISDASYAKSFFLLAAEKLGQVIDLAKLLAPPASELVHEFFHWKISWPYRNSNSVTRGFNRPEPPAAGQTVDGQDLARGSRALMDLIFRSVGSEFRSNTERRKAEEKVDRLFSRLLKVMSLY